MINPSMPRSQMSVTAELIQAAIALDSAVAPYTFSAQEFSEDVVLALRSLRSAVVAYHQQKFSRDGITLGQAVTLGVADRARELLSQQIVHLRGPEMDRWIGAVTELQRLCREADAK